MKPARLLKVSSLNPPHQARRYSLELSTCFFSSFERAAHDHPRGAALDQPGQRDREVDRELVVHAGRVVFGLEPVRTVEPAQPVAFDELPRERVRQVRVVVLSM